MLSTFWRIIIRAVEVVRLYRNWPYVFFSYLRLLRRREVIYILRNGIRFIARVNDREAIAAINDVWFRKTYIQSEEEIKQDYTVVDIGAHIGSFSVFAATRDPRVRVFSYEPLPKNFSSLVENLKLNKLENVKTFQLAVSGQVGKIKLYIDEKRSTNNSITISTGSYIEVNSLTLKDILTDNAINICDLLKLDCEGAEYEILLTTPKGELDKISNIALEYHEVPSYHVDDLKVYLEDIGFDVEFGRVPILYAKRHKKL